MALRIAAGQSLHSVRSFEGTGPSKASHPRPWPQMALLLPRSCKLRRKNTSTKGPLNRRSLHYAALCRKSTCGHPLKIHPHNFHLPGWAGRHLSRPGGGRGIATWVRSRNCRQVRSPPPMRRRAENPRRGLTARGKSGAPSGCCGCRSLVSTVTILCERSRPGLAHLPSRCPGCSGFGSRFIYLPYDSRFDDLRSEPKFQALLHKVTYSRD